MSGGYIASSKRDDWRTPDFVLEAVRHALGGKIDFDPCASDDPSHWFADGQNLSLAEGHDGLNEPWAGRAFVNPPFSDLAAWTEKCLEENALRGVEVVQLLAARTDTRSWHRDVARAAAVCFWKGRIRFVGAKAGCPFPVAFAYWGAWPWRFYAAFKDHGRVVRP